MTRMRWLSAASAWLLLGAACSQSAPMSPSGNGALPGSGGFSAVSGSAGLAIPLGANLQVGLTISEVIVNVVRGYTSAPFAVDIEITSINGEFHHHGHETVPLSSTTTLDENQGIATVSVPWTTDNTPAVAVDTYTICAQLVWPNDDIVGEITCIQQAFDQ